MIANDFSCWQHLACEFYLSDTQGATTSGITQPAEVKAEALALKDAIAKGEYHPFTGPLNKQDGSAWLAEGEVADDGTLLGMNFYVEGLEGEIPQ